MNTDHLALGYVLGTLDPDDADRARALADDPAFAAAVQRARADLTDVAHGLELVARDAASPPRTSGRWMLWAGIAAALSLLVAGATVVARDLGDPTVIVPGQSETGIGSGVLDACTLETLTGPLAESIVTGSVTDVRDGTADEEGSGGIDFQIATVSVDETIEGDEADTVHAFDYTYGAPWVEAGQQLLLFLASSADTVHERIEPAHLQVLSGDCGSVVMRDGQPTGVTYTMEDVRSAAG